MILRLLLGGVAGIAIYRLYWHSLTFLGIRSNSVELVGQEEALPKARSRLSERGCSANRRGAVLLSQRLQALSIEPSSIEFEPVLPRSNGAVFYREGRVFRLTEFKSSGELVAIAPAALFEDRRQAIVATWAPEMNSGPEVLELAHSLYLLSLNGRSMLKDAALLHLDLMREALQVDISRTLRLQCAMAGRPSVFIDIPSFEPCSLANWIGYRQFCELPLPLILQSYKSVDFRPWLRGDRRHLG